MFRLHTRAVAVAFAVSGCAVFASQTSFGVAAMAANTGGSAPHSTGLRQLLVDRGNYVINVTAGSGTTRINVIRN